MAANKEKIDFFNSPDFTFFAIPNGGLAQLARALAWHARGRRFDSDILHNHYLKPYREICRAFVLHIDINKELLCRLSLLPKEAL